MGTVAKREQSALKLKLTSSLKRLSRAPVATKFKNNCQVASPRLLAFRSAKQGVLRRLALLGVVASQPIVVAHELGEITDRKGLLTADHIL